MLELTDIEAGYGRTRVLHGVTVPTGKVVAVLGHNGAGKTTLLRLAIGLIKPSKGRVLFDGANIASLPAWRTCRRVSRRSASSRRWRICSSSPTGAAAARRSSRRS